MKLISWNVNGLRAILKKEFPKQFVAFDADVLALQETKLQAGQCDFLPDGYQSYWNYAEKKGYSGTAAFVKEEPLAVHIGIGVAEHDLEGRVITLEYPEFYFVTVYTPNAQDGLRRISYRELWEDAFRHFLEELDRQKPVIVCGDLNVARHPIDLANPESNEKSPGYSVQERQKFESLLAAGFVDSFRYFHPEAKDRYSWWSYRTRARERNVGWRIDYFLCSERLCPYLKQADILDQEMGSDHCPVLLEWDREAFKQALLEKKVTLAKMA